jgi:diketogulonate reductase-like aldo/keto reductase
VKWCKGRGVILEAYSPLVRGREAETSLLVEIAKKHNKTFAQVLIRWSLQKGFIPLPKSVTKERIEQNANVYDFALDEEDMKRLDLDEYKPSAWDPTVARLED